MGMSFFYQYLLPNGSKSVLFFYLFTHGLLYFRKGDVTLGELSDYITTNVRQQSILINRKSQTPTVTPASAMESVWRNRKLR